MEEKDIGKVTHYFNKISVAIIELNSDLKVGDTIHVKGSTSDFQQKIDSMQVDHVDVAEATAGQVIGIKVKDHVREHDAVFKVQ